MGGQCLFNLRMLKKCGLSPKTLTNFYRCTTESILSGCITAWYGTFPAHKSLQRVVRSAQCITGGKIAALQDTYKPRCHKKANKKKIKDNNPPRPYWFTPLPSRGRGLYRCKAGTVRLKNTASISRPDC